MIVYLKINENEEMGINTNQITFIKPITQGSLQGVALTIKGAIIPLLGKYADNFRQTLQDIGELRYVDDNYAVLREPEPSQEGCLAPSEDNIQ